MTAAAVAPVQRLTPRAAALIIAGLIALQAAVLFAMGRPPICTCGTVKLWHGVVQSSENSQHIFDWYSFTHVLHGFWLYFFGWFFLRRWPVVARLVLAVALEAGWEILENTHFVIDRYRAATISLDYHGDSIVNSVGDAAAMMTGFALARMFPLWASVGAVIVIEVGLIYLIRDNLFLNVLMLIYPIDGIRAWQAAPPI
jgi:Protein of unknown function (DUF2585)